MSLASKTHSVKEHEWILQKDTTVRTATASAVVQLNNVAFDAIAQGGKNAKGDALTVAQLAGWHIAHQHLHHKWVVCLSNTVST